MRAYNFDTAMTNYDYNVQLQNQEYAAQAQAYIRDQQNLSMQLKMNKIAAKRGFMQEQRVMNEIAQAQAFARQDNYVSKLRAEGSARLGSAGQSSERAVTMTAAEHGRNLAIMDASFTSAVQQHKLNMFDIALLSLVQTIMHRLMQCFKPQRLPDIPEPTMGPMPVWQEPEELEPNKISYDGEWWWLGSTLGAIGGIARSMAGALGGMFGNTPSGVQTLAVVLVDSLHLTSWQWYRQFERSVLMAKAQFQGYAQRKGFPCQACRTTLPSASCRKHSCCSEGLSTRQAAEIQDRNNTARDMEQNYRIESSQRQRDYQITMANMMLGG